MPPIPFNEYSNFTLLFHKPLLEHLSFKRRDGKVVLKGSNRKEYDLKSKGLHDLMKEVDAPFSEIDFADQCQRLQDSAAGLLPAGSWRSQSYHCDQDLAIGMGTPSFYENGIQLHHLYGFPYLPASSIKGAMRHWTIYRYFDNLEKEALKDPDFCLLFGDSAEEDEKDFPKTGRSHLIFWDAFPNTTPDLKVDILNTHFQKYYGGTDPPTDTQSPIPIYFLTVAAGATFQFLIGQRKTGQLTGALAQQIKPEVLNLKEDKALVNLAYFLLEECFDYWGIGAKTALGYGRLSPLD